MRLIDADALINKLYDFEHEHTYVDDDDNLILFNEPTWATWVHMLIYDASTVEAIPIEWLKENLIGSEFYFGKGVDNTLVGETVWEMIVDAWKEDNGDEWWREEQGDE